MNRAEARAWGRKLLLQSESPGLDVDLLLAEAIGCAQHELISYSEKELTPGAEKKFRSLIARRASAEPISYILGKREFYGREFCVNPSVLIPRPETELLVERAIEELSSEKRQVVDVGVGSGAIIISLALESPGHRFIAVDISAAALEVAKLNARRHGVDDQIEFIHGDLLAPLPKATLRELVVSNPPYISDQEILPADVEKFEPQVALRSGVEGLDIIIELLGQLRSRFHSGDSFLCEIGKNQAAQVSSRVSDLGVFNFEFYKDLSGVKRVLGAHFD